MESSRSRVLIVLIGLSLGCGGATIAPGHRGLLFDPRNGLQHDVLSPGYHRLGMSQRIDDYDVTYTTKSERIAAVTAEALSVDLDVAVIFRPILSELYELDTEIGPGFYDEIVRPAFRAAVLDCVAKHSFMDLTRVSSTFEDEVETALRRRVAGKHLEVSSVTFTNVRMPPEVVEAVRERQLAEQVAAKKKAELEAAAAEANAAEESKWAKEKREAEHRAELKRIEQGCKP